MNDYSYANDVSEIKPPTTINQLLILQMQHERTNASLYKNFSGICDCKGLLGASKYFATQSADEDKHFNWIFEYCCDRVGFVPELLEVPAIEFDENMFLVDMLKSALDLEILTTQKLCAIKRMAIDSQDYMTDSFLDKMILEQQEEEKSASDNLNRALMFGDTPVGIMKIDEAMGV